MKKTISVFMLSFCISLCSHAQVDSNRTANDTNTLGHNKVYNNKRNQDSINNKKKMPPKKNNGTSMINEINLLNPRKNVII